MMDSENQQNNKKCEDYLNGYCKYGKKCKYRNMCKYSHEEHAKYYDSESKSNNICYRLKNGFCPYGTRCKYSHDLEKHHFKIKNFQLKEERKETESKNNIKDSNESMIETVSLSTDEFEQEASNFLLCCPVKPSKIKQEQVNLKEYVLKRNLEIGEMFYNEKIKIDSKRQNVYKNDFLTFKSENEAIDNQDKLLFRQEVSFYNEIKRLNSISATNKPEKLLKSAYDREYERVMKHLPVYGHRAEILECLTANNVLVLVGLTGSGKSTQIVQYLIEAGFDRSKKICCTEPRKVACVSLAKRISEEMQSPEDTLVTYKVGKDKNSRQFNNQYDENRYKIIQNSKLILMTDKILLCEYQRDNMLKQYSCILIDEAHERSVSSDLLLCELKKLVQKRKRDDHPLKLIIMSATIDYDKFSIYFDNCPIIHVSGLLYPVIVNYEKMKPNYLDQAVDRIKNVIRNKEDNPGDVLVFLTSFEEIIVAKRKVEKFLEEIKESINYICLTLYGRMEVEEQSKVFLSHDNKTKIILSTNVAETSVTIDGVKIVIDSGRAKERWFDQAHNISLIKLSPISQSSAIQRKGRAGRTSNGICYRLYEESDFNQMDNMIQPEIFRSNLGLVILQLLSFNVDNPLKYDLIDRPEQNLMASALQKLIDLEFVDKNMKINELGHVALEMNQEPSISKFILEGINLGISNEILVITAMLSVSNILHNRASTKEEKNIGILKLSNTNGDLLTMLEMFNTYKSIYPYNEKIKWCNSLFLSINAFKQAEQILKELWAVINQTDFYKKKSKNKLNDEQAIKKCVLEAICASMHSNLAYFNGYSNGMKVYKLVDLNQEAYIHPSSSIHVLQDSDVHAELVIFSDIVRTDKLYIKNITPVSPDLIKKYTNINIEILQSRVKQEIGIETNPIIIHSLKSFNNNLIESLETKLGCIVNLKNDSIVIEVSKADVNKLTKIVEEFIEMVRKRIIEDMYEYRPEAFENVKLIVGKGLQTHAVLLNREYLRLNLFEMDIKITEDELFRMFKKLGSVLDARVNKAVNSRVNGYVIMNDIKSAKEAYNYFSINYSDFKIIPSASIESNASFGKVPLLQASWFLSPPNGKAFIKFKSQEDLEIANDVLSNEGYRFSFNSSNNLSLVVLNVTQNYSKMDEIRFKNHLSQFLQVENCFFQRFPVSNQYSTDIMDQHVLIKTMFSEFGEIDLINILPSSIDEREYKLKPRVDAHIKFKEYQSAINAYKTLDNTTDKFASFGLFHVSVKNREEIKVPGDVYGKYLNEIEKLKDITRIEFNCKTSVNEINEHKNKAFLIVLTGNDHEKIKQAAKLYNELLEPEVLTLPYFKYDQIRKRLNKENSQSTFEKELHILIFKDARYNQLKIYGKNRLKATEELLKDLSEVSYSITVDVKSFKAIIGNSSDNLKNLKEEFRGEIKCDFKNKTITLFSKLSQLRRFEEKIKELDQKYCFESVQKLNNDNDNCNICFTSCESPFRLLQCNHLFCFECIKAQVINYDMNSILECAADNCTKLLTIADIKKILGYNSKLIDQKCHISMNNYLIHSQNYKICKGCDDLIRVEKDSSVYFCERCNKTYCCKCNNEEHKGYACNDKEKMLYDKYLEKYTKKCPKCSAAIEKNQGCNHMTCTICKTHFCWICCHIAEDAGKIYNHLRTIHGGIHDII